MLYQRDNSLIAHPFDPEDNIRGGTAYHDLAGYDGHVARLERGEKSKLVFPTNGR